MDLKEIYVEKLSKLHIAEKKYEALYKRLCKTTTTDELKRVLMPADAPLKDRLTRLGLILKSHKAKPALVLTATDQLLIEHISQSFKEKAQGSDKVLKTIDDSTLLIHTTIGYYDQLLQMAKVLDIELDISLLDQSLTEVKNSYSYLLQISGNIIYSDLK
jgi:ferritin-like metal-binding protein YciE